LLHSRARWRARALPSSPPDLPPAARALEREGAALLGRVQRAAAPVVRRPPVAWAAPSVASGAQAAARGAPAAARGAPAGLAAPAGLGAPQGSAGRGAQGAAAARVG